MICSYILGRSVQGIHVDISNTVSDIDVHICLIIMVPEYSDFLLIYNGGVEGSTLQ